MTCTLRSIADQFYEVIQFTNAKGTVTNYRRHIESFIQSVNGKAVEDLRPLDLLKWGKTWHQIQAVQRLFGWATNEAELVQRHPFRKVRKPTPGQRKRTLSRGQLANLCRFADACFRGVLLALRETMARPQEVRAMCWEYLKCSAKESSLWDALRNGRAFFALDSFKSKDQRKDRDRPRIILITRRLGRMLWRLAQKRGQLEGPVFLNSQGKPWTTNAVRLRMKRLTKTCGLVADYRGERVVAYTIRHTQATLAAAKGLRDRLLAEIMGHTSTRTTARYQHLDADHLQAAWEKFASDRSPARKI